MEELYRYISFESFVGMVQKQALTFVSPELWDDPKELTLTNDFIKSLNTEYLTEYYRAILQRTRCQCWTTLSESDAMWRIYSFNKYSVRIRIDKRDVSSLDNISLVKINYSNEFKPIESTNEKAILECLSQKRIAFEHENEVRLIKIFQFQTPQDMHACLNSNLKNSNPKIIHSVVHNPVFLNINNKEEQCEETIKLNNINISKDISFAHIPNFIRGVMVNPFAPDWFVEVVEEYCKRNNIHFDGKSTLYEK